MAGHIGEPLVAANRHVLNTYATRLDAENPV